MELLAKFLDTLASTVKDVFPVMALLVFFQLVVLRRAIPNWKRVTIGFGFVLLGLAFFLDGLGDRPVSHRPDHGKTAVGP